MSQSSIPADSRAPQVLFRCDGCGQLQAGFWQNGWNKPSKWFQRHDADGPQLACSRECIDRISKSSGKTSVVLPI